MAPHESYDVIKLLSQSLNPDKTFLCTKTFSVLSMWPKSGLKEKQILIGLAVQRFAFTLRKRILSTT